MARVELEGVRKTYGEFVAVDRMDLAVDQGDFVVILGPSGCGKTTTLRLIAGFAEVTAGEIRIGQRNVTAEPPHKRNIGIVFQNYALFPHLTVFENVAFGLRRRRKPVGEIRRKVAEALRLVKLEAFGDRYPRQLSGGQQQRVAIARALAIEPDVLLLDEPLSNLDAKLRQEVRQEIRRLQRYLGITTLLVTHDQDEAMSLGDRLVVMDHGRIQQIGTPKALYENPANEFVATFIGVANLLDGRSDPARGVFVTSSGLEIACTALVPDARRLMIRPERVEILEARPADGANVFGGVVEEVTYLGASREVTVRLERGDRLIGRVLPRNGGRDADWLAAGRTVAVRVSPEAPFPVAREGGGRDT